MTEHQWENRMDVILGSLNEQSPCPDAHLPDNAFVVHGGNYGINDRQVEFACYPGFIISGQKALRCDDKGKWRGIPPRCIAAQQLSNMFPWWTLFISFIVLLPLCAYGIIHIYAAIRRKQLAKLRRHRRLMFIENAKPITDTKIKHGNNYDKDHSSLIVPDEDDCDTLCTAIV